MTIAPRNEKASGMKEVSQMDPSSIQIRLDGHDTDMREIKDSILGLDGKIEKAVTDLAREVRAALDTIRSQFAERQRTPWGVIFSGGAVVISAIGFIGSQALSPLQADVKALKDNFVPRVEHNFRQEASEQRFLQHDNWLRKLEQRDYDEKIKQIEDLKAINRELRRQRVEEFEANGTLAR